VHRPDTDTGRHRHHADTGGSVIPLWDGYGDRNLLSQLWKADGSVLIS
jgi:hypothetical protein